jgi:hypothetical protein
MKFLDYKDAKDMMRQTGLSAEECLKIVDQELERLSNEGKT